MADIMHTFRPDPTLGASGSPFANICTECRAPRRQHVQMACKCNGSERPCGYCQHMGH